MKRFCVRSSYIKAAQSIFIATRERHYCSYCSPKVRDHSENVISVKLEINKVFRISRSLKQRNEMFNISNILDSALFQGDRRSGFPWVVFLSQSVCLDDTQMCGLSGFRHGKSIGGMLLNKTKGDVHEDIHANSSRITTLHSTCC